MICNNLHKDQSLASECSFAPNPAQQREGAVAPESIRRPMLSGIENLCLFRRSQTTRVFPSGSWEIA
jgi:hypothetical protein